ncbi:cupin domain-containing protein [Pseudonocardia sp. GCM10023141]|uniref:cupin domain-containing protein n=1 Tax=Pseudonocardia sp. GCM10023141 TaxID=3252653 RepID=UPI00361FEBAD
MSLHAAAGSVPDEVADMGGTSFRTRAVFGNSSSLMIATRPDGYHSTPHTHDCEQLNWMQDGELWVFVVDRAFHLRTGDFLRIPAGALHWSWNRSGAPCTLVEVHTPGLQHDPLISGYAVGLHDEGEVPEFLGSPVSEFPDDPAFDVAVAEKAATDDPAPAVDAG